MAQSSRRRHPTTTVLNAQRADVTVLPRTVFRASWPPGCFEAACEQGVDDRVVVGAELDLNVVAGRYRPEMPSDPNDDVSTGSVPVQDGDALAWARGERWLPDPLLATVAEAGTFIDRVGFAVLFPAERVTVPSLWEAVAGPDDTPFAAGMGQAEERVWAWKDELPRTGAAWYGKFIHKRASLLSPELLTALYPGAGEPTDHAALDLPDHAHHIAEALLTGPLPTAALREVVGDRSRYDRAMSALQRHLLVPDPPGSSS